MTDDTTAPVTAEGLRERIFDQIQLGMYGPAGVPEAERPLVESTTRGVLAALAGDPGDLPARMADAIRSHDIAEGTDDDWDGDGTRCVCGEQVTDWEAHAAAAAMSVRWEHAASQAAEVERLREIERVTAPLADGADDMPDDPAEQREMWAFMVASWRWQQHMARKFSDQAERLRAELVIVTEQRDIRRQDCDDLAEQSHERLQRAARAESERDALKAAIETGEVARFAADVLSLVDDYSDRDQSVITRLAFLATFDQVCFEKYGLNTDQIAALDAPETPAEEGDQWRWDEQEIDGGFSGNEFPRLWPPRRAPGDALRAPETRERSGQWLEDLAKAGPAIHAAKHVPVTVTHAREWDHHPFVQSRAVYNVAVCVCGQPPEHQIHAPETPGDAEEATDG